MSLGLSGLRKSALLGLPPARLRGFGFQFVQIKSSVYVWRLKADCQSASVHSLTALGTNVAGHQVASKPNRMIETF